MEDKRLFKKFIALKMEKKHSLARAKEERYRRICHAKKVCERQIIYNMAGKELDSHEKKVLSLGLNFKLTPRSFPVVEYVAAVENLCLNMEYRNDDPARVQRLREVASKIIQDHKDMNIAQNLSRQEREALSRLAADDSVFYVPGDKGNSVGIEPKNAIIDDEGNVVELLGYIGKGEAAMDSGFYVENKRSAAALSREVKKKVSAALDEAGTDE